MIRNPRYLSLLIERKRHDWSFLPVVCWSRAFLSFLRFIVLRYFLHKRSRSFYALLNTYRCLFKVHPYHALVSRLHRAITKVIGRDISTEGPAYFQLKEDKNFFEQDLHFFYKNGGIVLKKPRFTGDRIVEKGALLLNYTESFRLFRHSVDLPSVLLHYVLILEPSWSGFTNPDILYFTQFKDQSIIVMAPEKRDYDFLQTLGTNLIPVSFGCGDWVNPSIFRPLKDQGKRYDAVMVARWGIYKRHHVLFRVLRRLRDPSFKVALVADPWPANREEIEKLIDSYGVRENIDIFENLKAKEVNKIMNQSKVNLLLSLQEGGNRALFEGFFAGVPGLALKNNIGIPKDYFNPQTGKLIEEKELKSELLYFREHWTDFNPRAWAEANITPEITTAKLNELLKRLAYQRGEEWTQDIVAKCNAPDLTYYPHLNVGREMPTYEDILCQYARTTKIDDQIVFGQDLQFLKKHGGIVLKAPRYTGDQLVEKGALLLKYTESFRLFCHCTNLPSVLQHYVLILEPSWSGYTDPDILYFTRFKDQPIIVMATEKSDYDFLQTLGTNLIPVSFGSSDWVNPSVFRPLKDQEKQYDAIYVAIWGKFKRHHVLFNVLRELRDPSFRVTLVSISPKNREEIELLVDGYGVRDNVTFFEKLAPEEVNRILNQSKVNLLLSLQEGSNRALFEGFFAGVPGLALKNNIGIPKDYFNPQTGKLIEEKELKSELLYFREHWTDFNPRAWAEANITPEITTAKLNEILKRLAYQRGEEWTQDIAAKCNAPHLAYYPNESIGLEMPTYEGILVQYARSKKIVDRIRGS